MRRALSTLLLSALLLGAQQAAFVHALGHQVAHAGSAGASPAPGAAAADNGDRTGDGGGNDRGSHYCDKCFQFAHVTGGAVAGSYPQLLIAAAVEAAHARPVAELAAEVPRARSRAPPAVL